MNKHYILILSLLIILSSCYIKDDKNETEEVKTSVMKEKKKPIKIDSLNWQIEQFHNDSSLQNASISYLFFSDSLNKVIAEKNKNTSLVPASTIKIITTSSALEILGSGKKFWTKLQYDGTISNRVLDGNIYIKGGGDPALGSKYYKQNNNFIEKWANSIKSLGIDTIKGDIVADAQIFDTDIIPPTWEWGEIGNDYGTAAFGISVYDNRFKIFISKNKKGKYKPSRSILKPFLPNTFFENKVKTASISKEKVYFLGAPYGKYRIVKGSIPRGRALVPVEGAIPDPPLLVAQQLRIALKKKGIISDTSTTIRILKYNYKLVNNTRTNISTIYSPSVAFLVNNTNHRSNNLFAEHLLKHIGIKYFSKGDTESGIRAIYKFLKSKSINIKGLYIGDGSGISRHNAISAKHLVDVLLYMKKQSKYSSLFYNSLAIAGKSGTLRKFCKNMAVQGKINAKSGSMTRVISYAGYMKTKSGQNLTFAIIINNYTVKRPIIRTKIAELMNRIYLEN